MIVKCKHLCCIGFLAISSTLFAIQRHVYESGGAQGIQNSINLSSANDTVFVHTGTYYVRNISYVGLTMKDKVTLISPHPDSVILSGLNSAGTDTAYHVIYCAFGDSSSHSAMIKNFTITDGNAKGVSSGNNCGGGIFCAYSSPRIDSCIIKDNNAENGGGVFLYASSPEINANALTDNSAKSGGGFFIYGNSAPLINDNKINNNSSNVGGGFFVDSASATIIQNEIKNNLSTGANSGGGGLLIYNSFGVEVSKNKICFNSANNGGGVYIDSCASSINIVGNEIKNNVVVDYGGGLHIRNTSPTVSNNDIINNFSGSDGAGIFTFGSACKIVNNLIKNNIAQEYGGALYLYHQSYPTVRNNIIDNNSGDYGAGLYVEFFSYPTLICNVITNNISHMGGAFAICEGSRANIDSCFIVDNVSESDTKSGLSYIIDNADTVAINYSHLYYNTFQPDTEINNATGINVSFENNFWWDTTNTAISGIISGFNKHTPFENNFIPGVPGEPITIDSVRNYDSTYSFIVDSLCGDSAILYLQIYGQDRNAKLREAGVSIIKSSVYPTGIAVALIETDTNSGIYQGQATIKSSTGNNNIRLDDGYNIIRADTSNDNITIISNMDTTKKFVVAYKKKLGVTENNSLPNINKAILRVSGGGVTKPIIISYSILFNTKVSLQIYDIGGRKMKSFINKEQKAGNYNIIFNTKDVTAGVYFVVLKTGNSKVVQKLVLIK
ncbi:MAG: right-handed parallel beta-helix repeat-containing protein [bacterium]|nr:right-handed parallel beta-helix repeat-containing protein [bacterium]